MRTIEQHLSRIYHPYWCQSDPRKHRWKDTTGPSGVLGTGADQTNFPDVGLFNLFWLMLDNPNYDAPATAAEAAVIKYVIYELQLERVGPNTTLAQIAAMTTLEQFRAGIERHKPPSWQRILAACDRKLSTNPEN